MNTIHPTAIIHKDAQLGENLYVGPYAIIEPGVVIHDGCEVEAHVVLRCGTILEEGVKVDSQSVLGGLPQYLGFDSKTPSHVRIGANTIIREHVTIHRSILENGTTTVGHHCFLMGASHVAHDCTIGEYCTLANAVLIAGHVEIGSQAFIGGGAAIHQFCRIGEGAMVGGNATITRDIPPYLTAAERNLLAGLNLVGLRRRETPLESIGELKRLYTEILLNQGNPHELAKVASDTLSGQTEQGKNFLSFFAKQGRKYCRPKKR
jgi:UDP-N-acetylglucosamine acyltransferase